jgi:hypothetical protein
MAARVALLLMVALAATGCRQASPDAAAPAVVPGLREVLNDVERVTVQRPGQPPLTLRRRDRGWWWVERDWPADAARIRPLLLAMAEARCDEPKTARPDQYPRLGVEPVTAEGAQSVQVVAEAGERRFGLLLGREHAQGGRYLRADDAAGSCLSRTRPMVGEAPADWLATALVDRPASHWQRIELSDAGRPVATLVRTGERFALRGQSPGAVYAPDALAGGLADLRLADVRPADPADRPSRVLRYVAEGGAVTVSLWREDAAVWFRIEGEGDEASAVPVAAVGRSFLLPAHRIEAMMVPPAALAAP